jgi:DNA-binding NtrC family response regulator
MLIVEDDEVMRLTLKEYFGQKGCVVYAAAEGGVALEILEKKLVDIVLLDLNLPDGSGLEFLQRMKAEDEELIVLIMTAYPDVRNAVRAMKEGAFDYIIKPFDLDEMDLTLERILEHHQLRSRVEQLQVEQLQIQETNDILGGSAAMAKLRELIFKVAQSPRSTVLVRGESGTGKEMVVNAIHAGSERRAGPLIKINCSAIPENLLEAEIFGYEKGAFTSAETDKRGLLELAHGGTLFLDELGDLSTVFQPKFLRVMEERVFRRVGGVRDIVVDVRYVAATNHDLEDMVERGTFREDLYFRFKVMEVYVPPLRDHLEDLPILVDHFIAKINGELGKDIAGPDETFLQIGQSYSWPGNVRELRNMIERLLILTQDGLLRGEDLPPDLGLAHLSPALSRSTSEDLKRIERHHILKVLKQHGGNKSEAAKALKIARSTLQEKLKRYQID